MSKQIETTFECPACDFKNIIQIKKPSIILSTVKDVECLDCKSRFLISFLLRPKSKNEIQYSMVNHSARLSPEGHELLKQKMASIKVPENKEE